MGVKLYLDANTSQIGPNMIGYYSNFDKEIRCFIDLNDTTFKWASTICHEFSHAVSARKQTKAWLEYEALELTMEDIQIKKKLPPTLHKFRRAIIAMEHEAEQNAIKLMKRFSLSIDLAKYAQEANFVLIKYIFLCQHRTWPNFKHKDQESLVAQFPEHLMNKSDLVWSKLPNLLRVEMDELRIK